jgi:thiol-disulfide isomerase/thioredoxin
MKGRLHLQILVIFLCHVLFVKAFRPRKAGGTRSTSVDSRRIRGGEGRGLLSLPSTSPTTLHAAMRFKNFEQVLDTFREEAVVIYFSTEKCGPCRLMKKEVATIQEMIGKELKMFSVDTEKWPQVGSRFEVARLPCLVLFREGEVKLRLEGVNSAQSVVEQVRRLL